MREYPSEHNKIVSELLDGKFIISPSPLFYTIQELEDDYTEFFIKSFNFSLFDIFFKFFLTIKKLCMLILNLLYL